MWLTDNARWQYASPAYRASSPSSCDYINGAIATSPHNIIIKQIFVEETTHTNRLVFFLFPLLFHIWLCRKKNNSGVVLFCAYSIRTPVHQFVLFLLCCVRLICVTGGGGGSYRRENCELIIGQFEYLFCAATLVSVATLHHHQNLPGNNYKWSLSISLLCTEITYQRSFLIDSILFLFFFLNRIILPRD